MKRLISSKQCKKVVLISVVAGLINGSMPVTALAVSRGKQAWGAMKKYTGKAKTVLSSKAQGALESLKKYSGKAHSSIQKLVACLGGKDVCTEQEIKNARLYTGIISAALTILAAAGLGWAVWPSPSSTGVDEVQEFINRIALMEDEHLSQLDWGLERESGITMRAWVVDNWSNFPSDVQNRLRDIFNIVDSRVKEGEITRGTNGRKRAYVAE